jgi:hypothetical protein
MQQGRDALGARAARQDVEIWYLCFLSDHLRERSLNRVFALKKIRQPPSVWQSEDIVKTRLSHVGVNQ